jgi:hypothetical protein
MLDQILIKDPSKPGRFGFVLPTYLETRALPDYWHHVRNMDLTFVRFDYRTVQVHGYPISYLFVVFSVQGLDLPPPCYCESQAATLLESDDPPAANESLTGQHIHTPAATEGNAQETLERDPDDQWEPPGLKYFPVLMPAQVMSFGLSQKAFREIVRSIVRIGHQESLSQGGTVYVSASFWFRATLKEAKIISDGVNAVLDFAASGSAKAAVRDKCGHDVLSAGVKLGISIDESSFQWALRIKEIWHGTPEFRRELIVDAPAAVHLGKINVDFDGALAPPVPLDTFAEWLTEKILSSFTKAVDAIASDQVSVRLIHNPAVNDNNFARLFFVDDKFFAGEAAVLLGHLTNYYG